MKKINEMTKKTGFVLACLSLSLFVVSCEDDDIIPVEVEDAIECVELGLNIIAGICKNSKSKANRTELTKLKEQCEKAELTVDIKVVISKNGFSNELKNLKGADLRLFALKNFKSLVEDLYEEDFIECTGKRY